MYAQERYDYWNGWVGNWRISGKSKSSHVRVWISETPVPAST